jgi:siroheme synthase
MKNDQLRPRFPNTAVRRACKSTFGRRAANDGKLVHRLREGKRITVDTLERIQAFLGDGVPVITVPERRSRSAIPPAISGFRKPAEILLFVHTCSEKRVIMHRVALDWKHLIRVRQPCGC